MEKAILHDFEFFFFYFIDTLTEGVTFSDCYFWTYAKGWNQQRDFVALSYRELYINDFQVF